MDTLNFLTNTFSQYSYLSVFAALMICGFGIPLPEDVTLVAGGVICGLGYANVHLMFLVGMTGVMAGDTLMFALGHHYGERVRKIPFVSRMLTPSRYQAVQEKFDKYGNWVMFVARFLPGLRSPMFLIAGMSRRVKFWQFFVMDGFAALISVPFWVYLGYYGANNHAWLLKWIHRGQSGIFITVGLLLVTVLGVWWFRRKRAQAKASSSTHSA